MLLKQPLEVWQARGVALEFFVHDIDDPDAALQVGHELVAGADRAEGDEHGRIAQKQRS